MKYMAKIIYGKLVYNDIGQFEIHNQDDDTIFNLSALLDKIYFSSDNNHICIKILEGCKLLFFEDGYLIMQPTKYNIYDYHVCGRNLFATLFESTDKLLEIIIHTETLGEDKYEQFYSSKEY